MVTALYKPTYIYTKTRKMCFPFSLCWLWRPCGGGESFIQMKNIKGWCMHGPWQLYICYQTCCFPYLASLDHTGVWNSKIKCSTFFFFSFFITANYCPLIRANVSSWKVLYSAQRTLICCNQQELESCKLNALHFLLFYYSKLMSISCSIFSRSISCSSWKSNPLILL